MEVCPFHQVQVSAEASLGSGPLYGDAASHKSTKFWFKGHGATKWVT